MYYPDFPSPGVADDKFDSEWLVQSCLFFSSTEIWRYENVSKSKRKISAMSSTSEAPLPNGGSTEHESQGRIPRMGRRYTWRIGSNGWDHSFRTRTASTRDNFGWETQWPCRLTAEWSIWTRTSALLVFCKYSIAYNLSVIVWCYSSTWHRIVIYCP